MSSIFWILSAELAFLSLYLTVTRSLLFLKEVNIQVQVDSTHRVLDQLKLFENALVVGRSPQNWDELSLLDSPWRHFLHRSLRRLFDEGLPTQPTLLRMRSCAVEHIELLLEAQAESAQPILQALTFLFIIPLFSMGLWIAFPAIHQKPYHFLLTSALASSFTGLSSIWMLKIADSARFGNLSAEYRPLILSSQCAFEELLAQLQAGAPPRLAWLNVLKQLEDHTPPLALLWRSNVPHPKNVNQIYRTIGCAGEELRTITLRAQEEGHDCLRLIHPILQNLKITIDFEIKKRLKELSTKALIPLFLGVLPSTLLILGMGIYLLKD